MMKKLLPILFTALMVLGFACSCKQDVKIPEFPEIPAGSAMVIFSSNDGRHLNEFQTFIPGETGKLDKNAFDCIKYGYEFSGWNTMADGSGTAYEDEADFSTDHIVVLHAQWSAIPFKFVAVENTTISMQSYIAEGAPQLNEIRLQYKVDDEEWQNYVIAKNGNYTSGEPYGEYVGPTINLDAGQEVFFKAGYTTDTNFQNPSFFVNEDSKWSHYCFVIGDGKAKAEGNIMFLLDETGKLLELEDGAFGYLFENCKKLISVPMLPATKLAKNCYQGMFAVCKNITDLPENLLPATTLADDCYSNMFYWCSGLKNIPENLLPATKLAYECYHSMFYCCEALISVPKGLLPATDLQDSCYNQMFYGCKYLMNAPKLPATDLKDNCYSQMFRRCSSLKSVTMLATDINASNCLYKWLAEAPEEGSLYVAPSMMDSNIYDYLPGYDWKVLEF